MATSTTTNTPRPFGVYSVSDLDPTGSNAPLDVSSLTGSFGLTLTDGGGAFDVDALRPKLMTLTRRTTGATIAGVGAGIAYQVPDVSGTLIRIGTQIVEITNPNVGVVDSTMTWCVRKGGIEIEVARLRGAAGMAAAFATGGSTAEGGGASGLVGGQLWVRGDFLATGASTVAGLALAQRTIQVSTSLTTADYCLWVNASVSGVTVTLPTAVGIAGQTFVIKLISSSNSATVTTTSAQTIDGQTSILINAQYQSLTFVSDNANWNLI